MWQNSICLGWKFLSESKLFGEGHWRFLAIWNFWDPAMRIFLPQYVTSRFYIVKGVPPPVFPWKIVWAKKPPHKRKTPKLFSKNWPKRAEIKVFGVKVLFLASSSYQSFLVTPPGPLTLLAPVTYLRISVQIRVRACWKNLTFLSYEFGKGQHTFYPIKLSGFAEKSSSKIPKFHRGGPLRTGQTPLWRTKVYIL